MTGAELFARAAELSAAGRPYAIATVVAVRRPTSARPGAHGIVHPDGTIEGWVGGSCAQPVVVREAVRSIADGVPRLLRISKDPPSDSRRADGIVEVVMTCHSGGTLEVYVEPQLAAPALWVVGTTPVAAALAALGSAAGFRTSVIDPVADAAAFPGARVITDASLATFERGSQPYVVVATQGVWDEEAVAAVLRRDASYVGLVASPTRAGVVREYLSEVGLPTEAIAALRAPAGLDLGAQTAEEIALSILAELVQVRRGRAPFVAAPGPATIASQPGEAESPERPGGARSDIVLLDPVCGMTVDERDARHLAEHDGVVYAFCSIGCRVRFMKDPAAYLPSAAVRAD
ncbi:MAG TPA: XdhC family protein [Candidatus Limnocylindrales bacterium]|nr:XdhC family protein [Candidatus Limnocylindrales bacterium]